MYVKQIRILMEYVHLHSERDKVEMKNDLEGVIHT